MHPGRAEVVEVALQQGRWVLVTQHELDMAEPGAPERRVDRLLRRPDRGAVRGGGRQSTWATGSPNRSRRVPSVTRESGSGACSPWTRRARTPRGIVGPAQAITSEDAEIPEAGGDVTQVPSHPG